MSLFSIFAGIVFAAETVLSPIPEDIPIVDPLPTKPDISFGQIVAVPTPTPEILGVTTIAPTPTPFITKKKSYTIAFLGDSMIDTMGPELPAVNNKLSATYPTTDFTLLNYGAGGTNIDSGIERIPTMTDAHPDIIVLESFAYNPFPDADGGITRHWLALARAVDAIRANIPNAKIIIAATIAPNANIFGDGVLNWNAEQKAKKVTEINAYLESTVKFASSQHLPLADAFHASGGSTQYINGGDHIHYSDAGRALFAQKVASAITANSLLQ